MDFVVTLTDLINIVVLGFGVAVIALAAAWHYIATWISGIKAKLSARNQRGFTLIELLIVVAIACILAAILYGNTASRSSQPRAISCEGANGDEVLRVPFKHWAGRDRDGFSIDHGTADAAYITPPAGSVCRIIELAPAAVVER